MIKIKNIMELDQELEKIQIDDLKRVMGICCSVCEGVARRHKGKPEERGAIEAMEAIEHLLSLFLTGKLKNHYDDINEKCLN